MDATGYWGWSAESGAGLLPRNWGCFVLRGLFALALGLFAFLAPLRALVALAIAFAGFALVDGALSVAAGLRGAQRKGDWWWELILRGAVGMAIGIVFAPATFAGVFGVATMSLALLILWSTSTGAFEVAAAVRLRREIRGEWLMALSGILSILFGVAAMLLLLFDTAAAVLSVDRIVGVYAVAAGAVLVALGFKLRGRRRQRLPT